MRKLVLIYVLLLSSIFLNGQVLSTTRSTDWTLAGLRDTVSPSNIIMFSGDNTGVSDVSAALQTAITDAPANSIVQLKAGNYKILDEIELNSFVTLRGMGAGKTTLNFNLGGAKKSCLVASGTEGPDLSMTIAADKEGFSVVLADASSINVGDYVRFIQDDADLVNDSWSERRTGQVSKVASKTGNTITLHSPLRMDFPLSRNPRVKRVSVVDNIGIECLTLNRVDQVAVSADRNKVSKIKYSRVVNSWIKGVESANCNYAHFEALYSANLLVSGCYFHDAFEYGTGGRAYGVMLHFATSESKVENTIFNNLRHAMILQAGANGNVFAYNSSTNARAQNGAQEEDMVCHGNYAYLNLFESNVCEAPLVDGSHGENGPYNTFFRNRAKNGGFNVTSYNILGFVLNNSNQNFLGNEGANSINGSGHQETLNSWQSAIGTLETSLAYSKKPEFLNANEYGEIGYGNFGVSASNPATDRYAANNFIDVACGYYVWEGNTWRGNFAPGLNSENFNARIRGGTICSIASDAELKAVEVEPGGRLELQASINLSLDTLWLKSNEVEYAQFNGNASYPTLYEMTIANPGWHLVTVPLNSATINQIEDDVLVNYSGNLNGASVYEWDASIAEYSPFLGSSEQVASKAFNIFLDDNFVKTGKGINQDGNLPVTLVFKGMSNNGTIVNSNMGYGNASNALGDPNGWNLIFNPYPCSIDLDAVFGTSEPHYQIGAHLYDADLDVFEIRTTTAVNNGNATTVAPGQSFFVKVDALADLNADYFDFNNSVRTLTSSSSFLKVATPGFEIGLSKNGKVYSRVNCYLGESRNQKYISEKDISGNWNDSNYAVLALEREGFGMSKLLAITSFSEENESLPVSFYSHEASIFSLEIKKSNFDEVIYLKDNKSNTFQELDKDFELHLDKGWTKNRYELVIKSHKSESNKILTSYHFRDGMLVLNMNDSSDFLSKVKVSSIDGKQLYESGFFSSKEEHQFEIGNVSQGVYLLQILEFGEWKSAKVLITQ